MKSTNEINLKQFFKYQIHSAISQISEFHNRLFSCRKNGVLIGFLCRIDGWTQSLI